MSNQRDSALPSDADLLAAMQRYGGDVATGRALGLSRHQVFRARKRLAGGLLPASKTDVETLPPGTYIITGAQNDVAVNRRFLRALQRYAKRLNARLLVAKVVYDTSEARNTKAGQGKRSAYTWDPCIEEYLQEENVRLGPAFEFSARSNVLATAVNPLSAVDDPPRISSAVPHQKRAMVTIPVISAPRPVFRYTTGVLTPPRFIERRAGQRSAFHHCLGALIVEVAEDGAWWARQLSAKPGGVFYDLNLRVSPEGIRKEAVDNIVMGDIHWEQREERVLDAAFFRRNSMAKVLRPAAVICHDYLDGRLWSRHNERQFGQRYQAYVEMEEFSVKAEMQNAFDGLLELQKHAGRAEMVLTAGNHEQGFCTHWLDNHDYRKSPIDALPFLRLETARLEALEAGKPFRALYEAFRVIVPDAEKRLEQFRFLALGETYQRLGVEVGQHGHLGPNGARGTIGNLAKVAEKLSAGHSHSAGIREGVWQAGHSSKRQMDYNFGPSSWSFSHIIGLPDGHRQMITLHHRDGNADGRLDWRL